MKHNTIITIGREYGSGGHEIGEHLSKALGIPLYDKNLIEMAAAEIGVNSTEVALADENVLNRFLSTSRIAGDPSLYRILPDYGRPLTDQLFLTQSQIIQTLAEKESCVIVGRCGGYVLQDNPNCINVFIFAPKKDRIRRIMELYNMSEKDAIEQIKKTDRHRKDYYETYTRQKWGAIEYHQMLINSSYMGIDGTTEMLKFLYNKVSKSAS